MGQAHASEVPYKEDRPPPGKVYNLFGSRYFEDERSVDEDEKGVPKDFEEWQKQEQELDERVRLNGRKRDARLRFDKQYAKGKVATGKPIDYDNLGILPSFRKGKNPTLVVVKAKEDQTDTRYALRMFENPGIGFVSTVRSFIAERKILRSHQCDFIVGFKLRLGGECYWGTLLEFMQYGSLADQKPDSKSFPEQYIKYCTVQITWAIEYLHELGFVYRGLKLSHVLVCDNFYVKISNFMNAKRIDTRTTKSIVRPLYIMPPAVHEGKEYGKGVDWWCLGILIFRMLVGSYPFCGPEDTDDECKQAVRDLKVKFPKQTYVSRTAKSFVEKLLQKDESERLGSREDMETKEKKKLEGSEQIFDDEWLKLLPFAELYSRSRRFVEADLPVFTPLEPQETPDTPNIHSHAPSEGIDEKKTGKAEL